MFGFAWSKDGKQLAFARGVRTTDVVMMSNFRKTGSSLQPSEVLRTDLELCNPNCRFLSFGILHKDVQVTVVIEHTLSSNYPYYCMEHLRVASVIFRLQK
jgi:hypothetical protein